MLINLNKQYYLMSIDTTTPISWIKGGEKCYIEGTSKKCTRV